MVGFQADSAKGQNLLHFDCKCIKDIKDNNYRYAVRLYRILVFFRKYFFDKGQKLEICCKIRIFWKTIFLDICTEMSSLGRES